VHKVVRLDRVAQDDAGFLREGALDDVALGQDPNQLPAAALNDRKPPKAGLLELGDGRDDALVAAQRLYVVGHMIGHKPVDLHRFEGLDQIHETDNADQAPILQDGCARDAVLAQDILYLAHRGLGRRRDHVTRRHFFDARFVRDLLDLGDVFVHRR